MHISDDVVDFLPPAAPPQILTFEQTRHLASQGWLPVELPKDLDAEIRKTTTEANVFFERSREEKLRLYPSSHGTECGYYHVPDEKQYITFRHQLHPEATLERHVSQVWHRAGHLLHRVLCDLSRAGYFDPLAWASLVEGNLSLPSDFEGSEINPTLLRLFHYFPNSGFASEHVDIGLLTLCVGNSRGLQVLDRLKRPPEWTDVEGPVILAGDLVRSLFKNRVRAGLHRVVSNPNGRNSLVFALRPCLRGNINLSHFGGQGSVRTREYYLKIKEAKYNINATKDIRDDQQKAQEERRKRLGQNESPCIPCGQG